MVRALELAVEALGSLPAADQERMGRQLLSYIEKLLRLRIEVEKGFRALDDEAFRASLTKAGFAPLRARSEASIKEFVDADRARWLNVVKKLNFSLD